MRRRLAELSGGDAPPALARLLDEAPPTSSPSAVLDREHLTLLDATGAGTRELYAALALLAADPAVLALYERLDALADAAADDPRIPALAADLVAAVPDEAFAAIAPGTGLDLPGFKEALLAEYAPAQAEVVRRVMDAFAERVRG